MSSPVDWLKPTHRLLLNPRLPYAEREIYSTAWEKWVSSQSSPHIGLATSGSSSDGFGRIVALSAYAVLVNATSVNRHLQATANDVWLKALPDFHVGGLSIWARASENGARVIESRLEKWSAIEFVKEIDLAKATLISLVPTQLFDLVQAGLRAPSCVRAAVIGGGRLEASLHRRSVELGWPSRVSYGMTECSSQIATARSGQDTRMFALDHAELRIDAQSRLEVRSAALLTGYLRFSDTGSALFADPKSDGWLKTDDLAEIKDGALYVIGRHGDFVKIGGEGVVVSRLEEKLESVRLKCQSQLQNQLKNHSQIALRKSLCDFALLAVQDDRLGARIILMTDAENEFEMRDVVELYDALVLPFEKIREVYCVSEIPRSALGKLMRSKALALIRLKPATNI